MGESKVVGVYNGIHIKGYGGNKNKLLVKFLQSNTCHRDSKYSQRQHIRTLKQQHTRRSRQAHSYVTW